MKVYDLDVVIIIIDIIFRIIDIMTLNENIRLVIWDLEETFWKGTLTEGGITHVHEHYELIKLLSRRRTMNSICSKNDFKKIKKILETQGIWEYFIFPSIDWQTKGPRVAEIVNASQLRAPTILFIDVHPGNRREVEAAAPGIQTADETL